LMCEEGEAAPRASPRLAEVDAPIERMLAQGMGHFKQEEGMEPDDLLCSRNARSRTPLVGRAQWKINQAPSLERNEQAWKEHVYRSMCAVEGCSFLPVRSLKGRSELLSRRSNDHQRESSMSLFSVQVHHSCLSLNTSI
jgi:hypothetical protein